MKHFEEHQFFRQKWLWIIILFFPIFSAYGIYEQIIMGNPVGDNPISNKGLIVFAIVVGLGLPSIFWNMKLKIRVSKQGLHRKF
jgi:hypothetical protein